MSNNVTFVAAVLNGDARPEDIDNFIDDWHSGRGSGNLAGFLGLTDHEFALWVEQPDVLEFLLHARRFDLDVDKVLGSREVHLIAARSAQSGESQVLLQWLRERGNL